MEDKPAQKFNEDFIKEDFDNVSTVNAILSNTEIDLQKLKTHIRDIESVACKETSRKTSNRRSKNSPSMVISRVSKKFLLLRNIHEEPVLLFKNKCPDWLVVLEDGYLAISESFVEVREEMKQLCLKFTKQKKDVQKISEQRSNYLQKLNEEMMQLEKEMEKEKCTFGELISQLNTQVNEQRSHLEHVIEKRNQLKEMNDNINEEIRKVNDKYWAVDASAKYEYEFGKGFQSKMEERYRQAMCEEEFIQKLRGDLEQSLKNVEQFRNSSDMFMHQQNETIRCLQLTCDSEVEKGKLIKENIRNKIKDQENSLNVIITKKKDKEKYKEELSAVESKISELQDTINVLQKSLEDKSDLLQEQEEEYESKNDLFCIKESAVKLEISLKVKNLEDIKGKIFKIEENEIVPCKQQITTFKERFHQASVEYETLEVKCDVLSRKYIALEMEEVTLFYSRVKFLYSASKIQNGGEEDIKLNDVFTILEDSEYTWNDYDTEFLETQTVINNYKQYIQRLNKKIQFLGDEIQNYFSQVQSLKKQTEHAALKYLSITNIGCRGNLPVYRRNNRMAMTQQMLPVEYPMSSPSEAEKVRKDPKRQKMNVSSIIWKSSTAPSPRKKPDSEQLYSNFGKFLFL